MPKTALFLGAGASKAFDYPTTKEFVNHLFGVLTSSSEKSILNLFLGIPDVSDVEHVLQIIDSVLNFASNPLFKGGRVKFPAHIEIGRTILDWSSFVARCELIKRKIISELHRQYEFDENKLEKIIECYDNLFGSIYPSVSRSMRAKEIEQMHVFTTNYDSVIENYCLEKQISFTCGFKSERGRRFWKPELFREFHGLKLYKLHGSLDWRETHDGRIEWVVTQEQVSGVSRRYRRNILIYPAQKEYFNEEPFRTLMRYFEEVLSVHDVCLVIGFSFRDPYINGIFLEFLRVNPNRKLIVVSPTASRNVEENLLQGDKKLKKQIICLDMLFGEEKTFKEIRNTLANLR
ncbi:hypothetical protein DRO91_03855 [Candidatus Heimdallarchaeota archaeon]|nr:MAG: hypothetical protein DRO91_03855 [Candidatus Heimdallarchaeota archaeon]